MVENEHKPMNVNFVEIEKAEAHNFQGGLKAFSNEVRFAERISELYQVTAGSVHVDLVTALGLFMESGHALVLSVLALLRCHNAQALNELRRAVECASYGHKTKDPHIAKIWVEGEEHEGFAKNFRYENRFDRKHPVLKGFKSTWEMASTYASHATLGAIMGHQEHPRHDKFEYGFFDLGEDHLNHRGRLFCFILKTNLQILQVFEEVFEKILSAKWKEARQKLESDVDRYIERFIKPHLTKVRTDEKKKEFAKAGLILPEDGLLMALLKNGKFVA